MNKVVVLDTMVVTALINEARADSFLRNVEATRTTP
jgi:hypothetical protein